MNTIHHVLLYGSIIGDIGGWLSGGIRNVKDLAGKVWSSFKHIWNYVTTIFSHVGTAWTFLHAGFSALIAGVEHLADGAYHVSKYLITHLVPKGIRHAISQAVSWAGTAVKNVLKTARGLVNSAVRFLRKEINKVAHALDSARRWLTRQVNGALHWIRKAGHDLWNLVMHPKRLVAWILPHLVTPLARWILSHLEALTVLVGRWFLQNIGKFATEIERAFTKLF